MSNPDSRSSGPASNRRVGFRVPANAAVQGVNFTGMSYADKVAMLQQILARKVHGISFSPYVDGQAPGTVCSEQQIRDRLRIIAPYTNWVRSFSCIEGHQDIPRIAREFGLQTMVGVGLGEDLDKNEIELANGIEIARAGHADILAVGNEILLRGDLGEQQLIEYIERARAAVPGVPVSFVDAYFLFEEHPAVADACDVLLVNCYPFWEGTSAKYALLHMKEMYRRAVVAARGKQVIISETGWPTTGTAFGDAVPSPDNALEYFVSACQWAQSEGIDLFYFSSFDESWKVGAEGDVGAYWGLWDKDGKLKYV